MKIVKFTNKFFSVYSFENLPKIEVYLKYISCMDVSYLTIVIQIMLSNDIFKCYTRSNEFPNKL